MEWPTPDYYRLVPSDVALDVNHLGTLQKGAWFNIWMYMFRQFPPGLMMPMDLEKLQELTELRENEWTRNRLPVLGRFVFHPATVSLHDLKMQRMYLAYADYKGGKSWAGKVSAAKRKNPTKIVNFDAPTIGPTPYHRFTGAFMEIRQSTWDKIVEILEKNKKKSTALNNVATSLNGVATMFNNNSNSNITTNAADAPALSGGGAGGYVSEATSDDVAAFLARHTDTELAALQAKALAASIPFNQLHYREKSPRQVPQLAHLIFNYVTSLRTPPTPQLPAQSEPQTAADGVA